MQGTSESNATQNLMSKKNELHDKKTLVTMILKNDYFARNSDYKVFEEYLRLEDAPEYVIDAIRWIAKKYDGNIFESLSRARRKVQEQFPKLRSSREVLEEREENRNDYKEWSLNS